MTRFVVIAVALGFLVPAAEVNAQVMSNGQSWGPYVRVTPFVGHAPQFRRTERWLYSDGFVIGNSTIQTVYAAGPALGGVVEIGLGRFGLVASGIYNDRRPTVDFETAEVIPGSDFLIAKAGLILRLRESVNGKQMRRLTASIFAGPAFVREEPGLDPAVGGFTDPIDHWAANAGAEAEIPVYGRAIALQLGIEDYVVLWNDAEIANRLNLATGYAVTSAVDTDPTHMWVLRLGLSFALQ